MRIFINTPAHTPRERTPSAAAVARERRTHRLADPALILSCLRSATVSDMFLRACGPSARWRWRSRVEQRVVSGSEPGYITRAAALQSSRVEPPPPSHLSRHPNIRHARSRGPASPLHRRSPQRTRAKAVGRITPTHAVARHLSRASFSSTIGVHARAPPDKKLRLRRTLPSCFAFSAAPRGRAQADVRRLRCTPTVPER